MELNRQLVEAVKRRFAEKSTHELEDIVRLRDRDRWSEEAFVAAGEVLAERSAGRAEERRVGVKDDTPPSSDERWGLLSSLIRFAAGDLVGGLLDLVEKQPGDRPVPFGRDTAWLAVATTDTAAVAAALGLRQLREVTWEAGVAAAAGSAVFVTPPLGEWTLAVGAVLLPSEQVAAFVEPLVRPMSRRFQEAQFFCTHDPTGLRVWARARSGLLLRGYGRLGPSQTLWNEGSPSEEERTLGFRFTGGAAAPAEAGSDEGPDTPDEECVLQLASLWSVDPTSLDEHFEGPTFGIIGDIARG